MAAQFEDHDAVAEEVAGAGASAGLGYVLVRPAMLTEKEAAPVRVLLDDGAGAGFMPSVSRKSVAGFLLDAAEKEIWDGKAPVIIN